MTQLLRIAKQQYFEFKIEEASNNIKQTWKLLNEIKNKRSSKSKLSSRFMHSNSEITDPNQIANKFCSYFSSIGQNLARQIPAYFNIREVFFKWKL